MTVPQVVIDGVTVEAKRLMLAPEEVGEILRVEESEVGAMVDRGELRDVSSDGGVRLDPNDVITLVEQRVRAASSASMSMSSSPP